MTPLRSMADRPFSSYAPGPWNSLPLEYREVQSHDIFKDQLKTYCFKLAFAYWCFFHVSFIISSLIAYIKAITALRSFANSFEKLFLKVLLKTKLIIILTFLP